MLWKNSFNVKYLENSDIYHNGVSGSRIWNWHWAIDWHHDLWPWMTLNSPSSRSLKLHVKYCKNGDRYNVGSHPCAVDWDYHLWPWITLNCPSLRSPKLHVKYFLNDDTYRQHWTDSEFAWTLSCFTVILFNTEYLQKLAIATIWLIFIMSVVCVLWTFTYVHRIMLLCNL